MRAVRVLLVTLGMLATTQVRAGVVRVNQVIDLDTAYVGTWAGSNILYSYYVEDGQQVLVTQGDEVHITYTFADGKSLRLSENTSSSGEMISPWLHLAPSGTAASFSIHGTFSTELLGFVGSPGESAILTGSSHGGGSIHLGPSHDNMLAGSSFIQFSGLTSVFTVDELSTSPNMYQATWFMVAAQNIEIISADPAAVPEPSTIATWSLLGCVAAGGHWWRKRKTAA